MQNDRAPAIDRASGAVRDDSDATPPSSSSLPPAMGIRFRSVRGSTAWLPLDRARTTIGRALACDVVFASPHVSRVHALITLVDDQHLLQDMKSANGTLLNGLPVTSHAFALRKGDVIEIGDEVLTFTDAPNSGDATKTTTDTGSGRAFPIADLVRDGLARLDGPSRLSLQTSLQSAFVAVSERTGLERCVDIVLERLGVHKVALFLEDAKGEPELIAARPSTEAIAGIASFASVRGTEEGEVHYRVEPSDAPPPVPGKTIAIPVHSVAAIPIQRWPKGAGAIVVERKGKRLNRADLALLAVMGERISLTLSLYGTDACETLFGQMRQRADQPDDQPDAR